MSNYKLTLRLENEIGGVERTMIIQEIPEIIVGVLESMKDSLDNVDKINA